MKIKYDKFVMKKFKKANVEQRRQMYDILSTEIQRLQAVKKEMWSLM